MHEPIHTISLKSAPQAAAPTSPVSRQSLRASQRFLRALPALLTLVVLAGTAYIVYDFLNPRFPSASTQEEARIATGDAAPDASPQDIVARAGELIVLPEGEAPTIAAVTDLAPLAGQPFFANAKVGDVVLLYAQAKKAILYDPVSNRIVETGPIAP